MFKKLRPIVIAVLVAMLAVVPAFAVQFGEPDVDPEKYPNVGLLVFDVDGTPAWRCSGTLLSPTVMLTAGHCTYGTSGGRVYFQQNVEMDAKNYPYSGPDSIEFAEIHTHPDYVDGAFYLYDAGVVILSKSVKLESYATLAEIGLLDEIATARGTKDQMFTVAGYGLQSVVPELQADRERYRGEVQLIDVNGTAGIPEGTSASFSNDPGNGTGEGGTCFGDSGGPIFHGDSNVIAAVTSYGLNANCAGTGGGYRVDTVDDQAFINEFLSSNNTSAKGKGK